jgi:hypothetical protein
MPRSVNGNEIYQKMWSLSEVGEVYYFANKLTEVQFSASFHPPFATSCLQSRNLDTHPLATSSFHIYSADGAECGNRLNEQ